MGEDFGIVMLFIGLIVGAVVASLAWWDKTR